MAQSSLEIGVEQARLAKAADEEDRVRQATERQQQRDTLLTALRLEVDAIKKSVELDLRLFNPTTGMQDERAKQRLTAWQVEKEAAYHRSYVWTPLPFGTVEQAIHETHLLKLTLEQVVDLQDLRHGILRANAASTAKTTVLPTLMQGAFGEHQGLSLSYSRLVDAKADDLNIDVQEEFRLVGNLYTNIITWIEKQRREG